MNPRQSLNRILSRTRLGTHLASDPRYRVVWFATVSLSVNLAYALYHAVLGILGQSRWFLFMCAYHTILGMTKFGLVLCERKTDNDLAAEQFMRRVSGVLLLLLAPVLAVVIYISLAEDRATSYGTIMMITIAAYVFGKIIMAIRRAVKNRHNPSPLLAAIRGIGYAELAGSLLTLQRSMLVSFGGRGDPASLVLNAGTGGAVCAFILILGIFMIKKTR